MQTRKIYRVNLFSNKFSKRWTSSLDSGLRKSSGDDDEKFIQLKKYDHIQYMNIYSRFRRGLSEQEVIMLGLQKDLEVANSLRKEVEKSKQVMLETNQRLRNEVQLLSAERDVLRNELNHLNAEFSTTKHRLQEYVGEVQDMERVLSQKVLELFRVYIVVLNIFYILER